MEEDPARPRLPAITSRQTLLLGLQDKVIKNFKGVVQNFKASRYSWKIMNACMPDLHTPSCRLVYFGGYGHKLLTDVDSRNRSFIVDEASWVIFAGATTSTICPLSSYLLIIWLCLQVEDVFWGWNNEVHVFDPMNYSWSEPKTNVSHKIFCEMVMTT